MERIKYSNEKLEKVFSDARLILKKCGQQLAKQLINRLEQLKSFECVYDLLKAPIDKPHLLEGDFEGCIAWSITGNIRLILDTGLNKNPENQSIFKEFKEIIIKGVVDYHGKKNNWIIC